KEFHEPIVQLTGTYLDAGRVISGRAPIARRSYVSHLLATARLPHGYLVKEGMNSTRSLRGVRVICFDQFELDVKAGELRRSGERVRLQEQPLRILVMLLEHPGQVVLREE